MLAKVAEATYTTKMTFQKTFREKWRHNAKCRIEMLAKVAEATYRKE